MAGRLPILCFLKCCLSESKGIFASELFCSLCNSFFMSFIHFASLLCSFCSPKQFCFHCIRFLFFLVFFHQLVKFSLLLLHIALCEFFIPALVDGLSLNFEWQQVSSVLQDSSQYPGRPQQCCHLDSLCSPSYFQLLQPFYLAFGDRSKCINYKWHHRHLHVPSLFF